MLHGRLAPITYTSNRPLKKDWNGFDLIGLSNRATKVGKQCANNNSNVLFLYNLSSDKFVKDISGCTTADGKSVRVRGKGKIQT